MAGSRVHLNFNRTWADVGAIVTAMDKKTHTPIGFVRDAFKNKLADRVHLKPGFKLYKFNNGNSLVAPWAEEGVTIKGARTLSEWWSPYEPYTHTWECQKGVTVDPGWYARAAMAKTNRTMRMRGSAHAAIARSIVFEGVAREPIRLRLDRHPLRQRRSASRLRARSRSRGCHR